MKIIVSGLLALLGLSFVVALASGQTADATPSASPAAAVESSSSDVKRAREFQGDDLGQVLRLLARQAKINLMIDDAIKGNVNVRLENASAMDTIAAIVHQYKLSMTRDDKGVYFLAPPDAADPALDFIAKPETATRIAAYEHNLYTALIKEGFVPEDALKIVVSVDPGKAMAAFGKKVEVHP